MSKESETKSSDLKPRWSMLMLAAIFYAVWLSWLAYIAWVNISAGNQ